LKKFSEIALGEGYKLSFVAVFTFLQFAKTDPCLPSSPLQGVRGGEESYRN